MYVCIYRYVFLMSVTLEVLHDINLPVWGQPGSYALYFFVFFALKFDVGYTNLFTERLKEPILFK